MSISDEESVPPPNLNEVDQWRFDNQKTLSEYHPSSIFLETLLIYQGVVGIRSNEDISSDDYIVTIMKQTNNCVANCCHMLSGVEYTCDISSYLTNWANFNLEHVQAEVRGIITRFQLKDGNIIVSETPTNPIAYDIGKISQPPTSPSVTTMASSSSSLSSTKKTLSVNTSPSSLLLSNNNNTRSSSRSRSRSGASEAPSVPTTPTSASTTLSLNSERLTGQIKVRVVTWNMYAQPPPPIHVLRERLLPLKKHHIYVIGSEECEHSIAESVYNPSKAHWEQILTLTMGSSFQMLCAHTLQATHSIVFVHKDLIPLVSDVNSSVVSTGIGLGMGNRLGNKGGVGISFKIAETKFMFINAHLAHAKKGLERRNEEYHTITTQIARSVVPSLVAKRPSGDVIDDKGTMEAFLQYFDVIVWAGDLNYRLTIEREEAEKLISENSIKKLLESDQLKTSIEKKEVFEV
jgi:hypothetical protein